MNKTQATPQVELLTAREREILQLLASGLTNREIGEMLSLTLHTVKWYVKQIYNKLQVRRRTEAAAVARTLGLLTEADGIVSTTNASIRSDPAPFVGRQAELAQLDRCLHTTLAGHPQIIFVTGEAGSGKSALVQTFLRRVQVQHPRLIAVTGYCNAFTGIGDPYLPFCEMLTLLTGDVQGRRQTGTLEPLQFDRLMALLPETVPILVEHGPTLLTTLLDGQSLLTQIERTNAVNHFWRAQLKALLTQGVTTTPVGGITQQRLFTEVTNVLQQLAQQRPLLLVLDDLQWADLGSLNLLFHLSRDLVDAPILIIGSYRASDVALGRNGERHPLLAIVNELQRRFGEQRVDLGQTGTPAFVDALLDTLPNRFTAEFRQAFYHQTRGHALFTVEMLRGLQERGDLVQDEQGRWVATEQLDWALLPARVEGILRERIERLPAEHQRLLQLACVEGEIFTAQAIAAIQQHELSAVIQQLSAVLDRQHRLVSADTTTNRPTAPLARYRFRHILFQQFAYGRLDPLERQQAHAAVAQALEALYQMNVVEMAVTLAHHFRQGGLLQKAVHYLLLAGQRANQMVAHAEAILHLENGLALLQVLPETSTRHRLELNFHLVAGPAHRIVNGYRSPQLETTFRRAQELCELLDDPLEFFPALWGMLPYYWVQPDLATAYRLAQRCLAMTQSQPDSDRRLAVHRALGAILYIRGDFAKSNHHLETGIALYRAQGEQTDIALYGFDNGICSLYYHSWLLWLRGYPDRALAQILATRQAAAQSKHPFDMVVLVFECYIRFYRGEFAEAHVAAQTLIDLAQQQNVATWPAYGTIQRGAVLVEIGKLTQGIVLMQEGIAGMRADDVEMTQPLFLTMLAHAYLQQEDIVRGLQAVDEALERTNATDERHWEAESLRVRGELLLKCTIQEADRKGAEACFHQALQIARRQQAKSLELRVAMSLSRLWLRQHQTQAARDLMESIYDWFTEGQETADLQAARALLVDLQRPR
ncbi:MAG: AAA family ATPase [Caldilineaceae bacterium]